MTLDESKIRLIMELRREGIADSAVLGAIERTPREIFIPTPIKTFAYDNRALPIGAGQTISQPYVVAYMTQALKLDDRCKVLEIGTGSGYQTAILAKLARRVYTIERHKSLAEEAGERFKELDLHTISTRVGDGSKGWPEQAPFDRIIVTAASEDVPETLLEQLAVGGIMVVPIGPQDGTQHIYRFTRTEHGFEPEKLLPVRFVPLVESEVRDSA
ncbi:protein-L-isoaspartate(D-aspartate) O-methyltransferase [Nisaea acidiphila]|uniref:Protein-L-isoaspartate O-methyltransferase n=1 Tax=Nisaea acidiphila TaxID=1862145 RepID=A0A9J7AUV7_9PROT|nr:protein-L-isoaspartate(D-aspartate) O-methyltransferase [Nisaea acidiphila]UUX50100.1 protein-L-isoaspartate(D-aspartate) O-methyltransferase [Nisaea acidiphila]